MNRTFCKGCGQEIRWIQTPEGKYMPVDPEPVLIRIQKGGRHRFVLNNGVVVSGEYMERREIATFEAYETHWASCKAAGTFRRKKQ